MKLLGFPVTFKLRDLTVLFLLPKLSNIKKSLEAHYKFGNAQHLLTFSEQSSSFAVQQASFYIWPHRERKNPAEFFFIQPLGVIT